MKRFALLGIQQKSQTTELAAFPGKETPWGGYIPPAWEEVCMRPNPPKQPERWGQRQNSFAWGVHSPQGTEARIKKLWIPIAL